MSGCRVFIGGVNPRATERDIEHFFKGFGRIRDINLKTGYGFVEFVDHQDADDAVYEMNNQTLCGGRITVEHAKGVPRNRNTYNNGGGGGGRDYYGGSGGGSGYYGSSGGYGSRGGGRDYGGNRYGGRDDRGYGGGRPSSRFGPPSRTKHRLIVENVSSRVGWQDLKDLFRPVGEVTFAEAHQYIKGEGVVDFGSYADLKNAIEKLDGSELMGRKIRLVEEKSASRSKSRSQSRSSNRSWSRSRSRSPVRRSRSPRNRSRSPRRRSPSATPENGNEQGRSRSPTPQEQRSDSKSPARE